jgi:flagellar biosynthesis protein FliP
LRDLHAASQTRARPTWRLFNRMAKLPTDAEGATAPAKTPMRVLVPAFVTSELKTGVPDRLHGVHPVHRDRS